MQQQVHGGVLLLAAGQMQEEAWEGESKWLQPTFRHVCVVVSDFAEKRLKLAEILYYKVLENVMVQEMKRLHGKDMSVSLRAFSFIIIVPLSLKDPLRNDGEGGHCMLRL